MLANNSSPLEGLWNICATPLPYEGADCVGLVTGLNPASEATTLVDRCTSRERVVRTA